MSQTSHARHFSKRQSPAPAAGCTNGAFFKSPKQGDAIDTSQPINIAWDTSLNCFSTPGVDIYLYAPYNDKSMIHAWGGVSYSAGSFQTPLVGSWWNSSTAPISLQLGFVEAGTPAFLSPVPTGPTFSATFNTTDFGLKNPSGANAAPTASDASGGGVFQTIGNAYASSGLPKGSIAAAVVVPLVAIAIAIAVYVRFQRTKEAEKRKRWSHAVDKRMSTISTEWKGLPPGAQSEAIRQSIAIMRDSRASVARMSQLYGTDARPVSAFPDGGQAGVGVGVGPRRGTGVGLRHQGADGAARLSARKSAVSFAASTRFERPSPDTMPAPRAFHTAELMSPTQVGGPTLLADRDIRPLELALAHEPAVRMMDPADDADFLLLAHSPADTSPLSPPAPVRLSPAAATPYSPTTPSSPAHGAPARNPFEGFTRGPSNMASPDAMLRAYAARSPPPVPGAHGAFDAPAPPANLAPGPPPRTLYAPAQPRGAFVSDASRYSVADEDAYGGYGHAA